MSTSINEAREALYQYFAEGWPAAVDAELTRRGATLPPVAQFDGLKVPYALGDEGFDPFDGLWVRFSVKHLTSAQETLATCGNRNFERSGRVFVQAFAPPGNDGLLDIAIDAAVRLFEGRSVTAIPVRFNAVQPSELGIVEQGRYAASTAECPFGYTARH